MQEKGYTPPGAQDWKHNRPPRSAEIPAKPVELVELSPEEGEEFEKNLIRQEQDIAREHLSRAQVAARDYGDKYPVEQPKRD